MSMDPGGTQRPYTDGGDTIAATSPTAEPVGPQHYEQQQQHRRSSDRMQAGVMTPNGRPGVYIYPFWQRSEFWAFLLTAIAIGIAAAVADSFDAKGAWQLIAGLAAAYILSRGFAKKEPREDDDDQPWAPGDGGRATTGRFSR